VLGGYGFVAVFACGMTIRAAERGHEYHAAMHEVVSRLERLLTLVVLMLLGMGMTNGILSALDWRGVLVAVALVLVVRPVAGWLALSVRPRPVDERRATAFFGVRGIGTLYYLAWAAGQHAFPEERWLWATVAATIALSVLVHGVLATPVLRRLEARREARREARA
jgi:NhaP-type Na+/H+ or K+/H+ antiporter